ncbi:MAG: type I restriction endonuclease, partial [Alphaproteobacteria bacterium]|nr:type I restriction endonuclease [Alphaproteobacteria bacterium]
MNYNKLSEEDTKRIEITPSIIAKGWDNRTQIRQELSFTKGRIMVRGKEIKRGEPKRADYVLFYKPNLPLAIVEAKVGYKTVSAGIQQGIDYAQTLNIPFAYSSNGKGFYEHDLLTGSEKEISLEEFPTPNELWQRYKEFKGLNQEQESKIFSEYYDDGSGRSPRYYQRIAINKTIEAIAKAQDRILPAMATGTATMIGRAASQVAVGWIPGAGNIINAATAGVLTESLGWILAKEFEKEYDKEFALPKQIDL